MAKIDIAGELNAATTERIVADSAQIRYKDKTVEKAMVTYGDSDGIDDVPGGGGGDDQEYSNATPSADGLMSKEDKALLDSLPPGILDSIDPFTATADVVSFNYYSTGKKGDKPYGNDELYSEDIPAATHTSAGVMTAADKAKVDAALTGDGVASVKVVTALPEVQEDNILYIVIAEEA